MEIHLLNRENIKEPEELIQTLCRERFSPDFDAEILRDERGKPYFVNLPDVHFSVSHSGDFWAVAIDNKPVGIDIEAKKRKYVNWIKLAERFFTPDEYNFVKKYGKVGFFRIWVRKEACVKLTGQGLSGIRNFSVVKDMKLVGEVPMGYVDEVYLGEDIFAACCSEQRWKAKDLIIIKAVTKDI